MTETNRKKVVLVCMVDSIHVARWLSQFNSSEIDFTLFPSTPNRRVHAKITGMMHENGNISIAPFRGWLSIPLWGLDLVFRDYVRGLLLRRIIRRVKPDFVHALELQHAGYITSRALEDQSIETKFIATNYGSDIYWFQRFPRHLIKIKKLLTRANRYSAECHRDIELAKKYGFTGDLMPVMPNSGKFEKSVLSEVLEPTSARSIIAVKGYDGWAGMSIVALKALSLLGKELDGLSIVVFSASWKIRILSQLIRIFFNLEISAIPKNKFNHEQMLDLFSKTKVFIGLSRTDGISTSFLESTIMGAFPIQTSSSCAGEWIENGIGGALIDDVTVQNLVEAIQYALVYSSLDASMSGNSLRIRRRLDPEALDKKIRQFYDIDKN